MSYQIRSGPVYFYFIFQVLYCSRYLGISEPLEALKHFYDDNQYDLVVLDIRMPEINGLELFYRLKEINKDTKVLFLTALETPEELVSALPGIQSENIIKKPVESDYFLTAIKKRLPCLPLIDKL